MLTSLSFFFQRENPCTKNVSTIYPMYVLLLVSSSFSLLLVLVPLVYLPLSSSCSSLLFSFNSFFLTHIHISVSHSHLSFSFAFWGALLENTSTTLSSDTGCSAHLSLTLSVVFLSFLHRRAGRGYIYRHAVWMVACLSLYMWFQHCGSLCIRAKLSEMSIIFSPEWQTVCYCVIPTLWVTSSPGIFPFFKTALLTAMKCTKSYSGQSCLFLTVIINNVR